MSKSQRRDYEAAMLLSRRELLGAAGAATVTVLLPWPVAGEAAAAGVALRRKAGAAGANADDVWGVYPRYAEPIAFAKPRAGPARIVDPLDAL